MTDEPPFSVRMRDALCAPLDADRDAARRTARLVRRLGEVLVAGVPAGDLASIERDLERIVDRASHVTAITGDPSANQLERFSSDLASFVDFHPLYGEANPIAPPLRFQTGDGPVVARGSFGPVYQGGPGMVHGAYVAATFDAVLAMAVTLGSETPRMTASLEIRFLRPTPILTELEAHASIDRTDGRKVYVIGHISANGTRTAEATALFVAPRSEIL